MSLQEEIKNTSLPDTIVDEVNSKCTESINEKLTQNDLVSNGNEESISDRNGLDYANISTDLVKPNSNEHVTHSDEPVTNPDEQLINSNEQVTNSDEQMKNSDEEMKNSDEQIINSDESKISSDCLNIETQPDEQTNVTNHILTIDQTITEPIKTEADEKSNNSLIEPNIESVNNSENCNPPETVDSLPDIKDSKLNDDSQIDENRQTNDQTPAEEAATISEVPSSTQTQPTETADNVAEDDEKQPSNEIKATESNEQFLTLDSNHNDQVQQSEQLNQQSTLIDASNVAITTQEQDQLFVQQQDELNQALNQQQQQILLQQTQNPETGEVLFVLQGENGEQIAIPPEAISNGFVQIRDGDGNEQLIALALSGDDGASGNLISGQNLLQNTSESNDLNEQVFLQTQQPLEVSADIINTLGAANIQIPPQQLTPTTASTNVVQSLETPRVSTQETTMTTTEMNTVQKDNTATILSKSQVTSDDTVEKQLIVNEESNKREVSPASIDLIQNSLNTATLDNMVSNATTLLTGVEESNDQNFVIMTGDNQLTTLGNLSNQLAVAGQTFLIETADGLLQCTMDANGALQLLQNSDDVNANNSQNQYITIQNVLQENQIIEAMGDNGQPITFTVSSSNDEIQFLPVNNHQQQSSLLDLKNSNLTANKSTSVSPIKSSKSNQSISHTKTSTNQSVYLIGESTSSNKTIVNPTLNTNKKQNVSIIQNINHQPHLNPQQITSTNNVHNSQSSNRKRIQHHNQRTSYNLTIPASSNAKSSSSNNTSASNLLISSANNGNEDLKRTYANYTQHQLQTSSNMTSSHVNKQDTNLLSSSRRTYSRKNILWLNPVQANSNSTTASPANNQTENKEDKLQLKKDSFERKSITITPVKDNSNLSERNLIDRNLKSSPSHSIKKGTITISTIIDSNRQSNRTSNVYNQVKIVPSETQSRLFKNLPSTQTVDSKNELLEDDLRSVDESCEKMEIDIRPANNPANDNKKTSSDAEDKPAKRLKRSLLDESVEAKTEVSISHEAKSTSADAEEKNKLELINSIINDPVIDDQLLSTVRHESGRRKSPIKPLKDCDFNEETKDAKLEDENDMIELDSELSPEPIVEKSKTKDIAPHSEKLARTTRSKIVAKSESKFDIKSEEESTAKSKIITKPEHKSEEGFINRSKTVNKSESKSEEESTISTSEAKRTRRSCRLPKDVVELPSEKVEKEEKQDKVIIKEVKITKVQETIEKKEKPSKVEESINKNNEEISLASKLRRGRSSSKKVEEEATTSVQKDALKDKVQKIDSKAPIKEISLVKNVEPEKNRIDEDSVKFDLLFKSQPAKDEKQSLQSEKNKKVDISKSTSDNEMEIEITNIKKDSKTTKANLSVNIEPINVSSSDMTISIFNQKRSLRSASGKSESTSDLKNPQSPKASTTVERRKTLSSIKDVRDGKEFYDEKLSSCEVHIRYQSPKSSSSSGNHMCQKCGFTTNRINLLVQHHKSDCQTIKSQFHFWHDEIKRVQQQQAYKMPMSKKQRILDSSGKLNDLECNDKLDYPKGESSDDEMLSDREEDNSKKFPFEKNEVVWVELKEENVKWPALVQQIKPNTNQVLVYLIDAPADRLNNCNTLVYSINDVITFNNANQNIKFLDETKSQYDDSIVKVVQKAEDYTRKKLLGENLDLSRLLGDRDSDSKQGKSIKINNASLLQYIKSGRVEAYLLGIYKESIESDLHKAFKSGVKASSSTSTHYGPFDNEEDRENLFNYCLELFKSNFKVENDDFDVVDYLMDVWVPSALIKGINRLYRITMEEAENILNHNTTEILDKN